MSKSLKTLCLAIQFLTRLPTPTIKDFHPSLLSQSAAWFPAVGLLIGLILYGVNMTGQSIHPLFAALMTLITWAWITGGLHLDGLADLADALGAAHRSPERFLAVLKDPHLGSFGVITLIIQITTKLCLIYLITLQHATQSLILIPAIARIGPLYWSKTLPPLGGGMAEQFAWNIRYPIIIFWGLTLAALAAYIHPLLVLALLTLPIWQQYLKQKIHGVTGDCLGAGIEVCESLILLLTILVFHSALP